jgi:hypothetical protein
MRDSTDTASDGAPGVQDAAVDTLSCPAGTIDAHAARVTAGIVLGIALLSLWPPAWWLTAVLAVDFFIRAWVGRAHSPLRWIAKRVTRAFGVPPKPAYAPPKQFAARVGSVLTLIVAGTHAAGLHTLAGVVTLALVAAASLEAFAGFCVACWLYPHLFPARDAYERSIHMAA